ncbi:ribosome assembly factor SBDS [Candidatus Woesearchaeota archaeon]|nr:ribosome assembly factor SBDS [Candidatus Woesearchaeota archaeon]
MIPIDKAVVARVTKNNKHFEILVDPDSALNAKEQLKSGKDADLFNTLAVEDIFTDSKKGIRASKKEIQEIFGTDNLAEAAKIILREGVVHTTSEQRDKEKQDKLDRIVALISTNAIDAQTKNPIPRDIVSDALRKAMFHVDGRKVEDQLQEAIKSIRKIIPLSFQERTIQISNVAPNAAGQCHELCKKLANVEKEDWSSGWSAVVKVPAGMREELMDRLNEITRGKIDMKLLD